MGTDAYLEKFAGIKQEKKNENPPIQTIQADKKEINVKLSNFPETIISQKIN